MSAANPVVDLLCAVVNTRAFGPAPVPATAERAILEVARHSGSGANRQPWHFVVVRDPQTVARIGTAHENIAWVAGAPLLIVVVMANQSPGMESFDEGRVTERMLIAASALGLGAGMGWLPVGPARDTVRQLLGAPEGAVVRTVVAVGTPAPGAHRRPSDRKPLAEVASRERYGAGGTA